MPNYFYATLVFSSSEGDELLRYDLQSKEQAWEHRRALEEKDNIAFARYDDPTGCYAFIAENPIFAQGKNADVAFKLPQQEPFSQRLIKWVITHHVAEKEFYKLSLDDFAASFNHFLLDFAPQSQKR